MKTIDKKLCEISVADVHVGKLRARRNVGNLDDLKLSISRFGFLHPIAVKPASDGYLLIAGERRLSVANMLGIKRIMAQIYHSLSPIEELDLELEENLRRDNLNPMDLAEALKRRKLLYEKLHPETKVGATGGGRKGNGTRTKTDLSGSGKPVTRFTKAASERFDISETTVKELIQLNNLPTAQKMAVRKGQITKTEALKIARDTRAVHAKVDTNVTNAVQQKERQDDCLLKAIFELNRQLKAIEPNTLSPLCVDKLSSIAALIENTLQAVKRHKNR